MSPFSATNRNSPAGPPGSALGLGWARNPDNLDNIMRIPYFVIRDRRGGYLPRTDFMDFWQTWYSTSALHGLDPDDRRRPPHSDPRYREAHLRIGIWMYPYPTTPLSCTTRTRTAADSARFRRQVKNRRKQRKKKLRKKPRYLGYST
jgi:hypothetical protein